LKPKLNQTIKAGSKTLKFVEIINKGKKTKSLKSIDEAKQFAKEMPKDPNNSTLVLGGPTKLATTEPNSKKGARKIKKKDENEGSAVFEFQDSETGLKQKFAFNLRYYIGAYWNDKYKSNPDHRTDGLYEFAVNGTAG